MNRRKAEEKPPLLSFPCAHARPQNFSLRPKKKKTAAATQAWAPEEGPLMSPNIGPCGTHGSIGSPQRLRDFKPCDVCTPESCFVQMSAYPKTQKEFLLRPSCGVNWENKSSIARRISAEKWKEWRRQC